MDRLTTIKAAACTAAAALTAFWGWTGWLAAAWFLAMLLDYATGSAAALRAGTWSSRAAREGLWHKAGSVAGVLVAALLDFALRVLLGSVPGLGIDYCVRNRLMNGVGAGTFSPDTACTRAQIVKILYNLSGNQTDYSYYYLPFTDVAPGAWYYNAVAWAYYNDVTSGTSATMFTPNAAITRQQLVTFLYRYTVKYAPEFTGNAAPISAFPDADSVANWAYAAMSWAVGNGLIQGNAHDNGLDYLDPNGSATRAQTATIIMRYCQLIGA